MADETEIVDELRKTHQPLQMVPGDRFLATHVLTIWIPKGEVRTSIEAPPSPKLRQWWRFWGV